MFRYKRFYFNNYALGSAKIQRMHEMIRPPALLENRMGQTARLTVRPLAKKYCSQKGYGY